MPYVHDSTLQLLLIIIYPFLYSVSIPLFLHTTHVGAFGASFRQKLWKDVWLKDLKERGVPFTANVDPLWVLASESKSATWQTEGES